MRNERSTRDGRSDSGCLWALATVVFCGFVVGVPLLWQDFFGPQAERMELWKQFTVWIGEAVAIGWGFQFIIRHALGMQLQDHALSAPQHSLTLPFTTIVLGLLADLCVTGIVVGDEYFGFQIAKRTLGKVIDVQRERTDQYDVYYLRVQFTDQDKVQHESRIRVTDFHREGFPVGMQQPGNIRAMQPGFGIDIAYDPKFPQRIWARWETWCGGIVSIHLIMLLLLAAQIGSLIWFAVELKKKLASGVLPWWHELYKLVPVAGEAAFLLFAVICVWAIRLSG